MDVYFDPLKQGDAFDLMTAFYAIARERNVSYETLIGAIVTMIAGEVRLNFPEAEHDKIIAEYAKSIKITIEINGPFDEDERAEHMARCKALMSLRKN